jgi:hypothetical protein
MDEPPLGRGRHRDGRHLDEGVLRQRLGDHRRPGRRQRRPGLLVGVVHRCEVGRLAQVDGDDDGVGERRVLGAQPFVETRQRHRRLFGDVGAGVRRRGG